MSVMSLIYFVIFDPLSKKKIAFVIQKIVIVSLLANYNFSLILVWGFLEGSWQVVIYGLADLHLAGQLCNFPSMHFICYDPQAFEWTWSIKIGKKLDLSDFKHWMVAATRWAWSEYFWNW